MIRIIPAGAVAAALLTVTPLAVAGKGDIHVRFSDIEVAAIHAFYGDQGNHHRGKGKGQGKGRKSRGLPPGVAKNLARGKALPPGISKQALPANLISLLPRPPKGLERIIVDRHILLIDPVTRVIHDKLMDIL